MQPEPMSRRMPQVTVGLLLLALPTAARANDGTPPWIQDVVQEGQDVDLTLAIVDRGEPGLSSTFQVIRTERDGEETVVMDDHVFATSEASSSADPTCRWWDDENPADCEDEAVGCDDCDHDGTPECDGWCQTAWYFVVTDTCVPTGDTSWTLATVEAGEAIPETSASLRVTDSGETCRACGCGASPGPAASLALAGMGLVGLVALRGGRRRRA